MWLGSLQAELNSIVLHFCRLKPHTVRFLQPSQHAAVTTPTTPWLCIGAHGQNSPEFRETGTDPDLSLVPKRKKKKSEQCFWSSVSMAKACLMALGGFKVCPFFQSWHIICPRGGQQEDVQHVAHTWSQIQVHKRSTRGSYDSVTRKLMCQLSKRSIFLHTQHWLSFLLPQQFTFSLSLHPI